MTIMPKNQENDNAISQCCDSFLKRYQVNRLLKNANATKEKGIPAYGIFAFLVGFVFTGKNFYTPLANFSEKVSFGKDAVYGLLSKASINWEGFLLNLSCAVVMDVDRLTSDDRKSALIIDDSPYYRNRSKKVEMLSRCFDHVTHKYYKGLTLLMLGWSDGQTFLPISFRLLASGDDRNLLEGSPHVKEDRRTLATRRRTDARKSKPTLVLEMLKAVIGKSAQAKYVLFESWFASPSAILPICRLGYSVVTRLKRITRITNTIIKEKLLSIRKICNACPKRRRKSRYLLSVNVKVRHKDFSEDVPAKIVFVRDKASRKKWIALLSTDITLSGDEVIALYGKRWDIEPFHKMLKSYLCLERAFCLCPLLRHLQRIGGYLICLCFRVNHQHFLSSCF